jgi:hypothetical protein
VTPGDHRRDALLRRYLRLGAGELTAAAVFACVAVATEMSDREARIALWSALTPLLTILVQAGAYWLLARRWVGRRPMPAGLARLYRVLRPLDAGLLLAGIVGVVVWAPGDVVVTAAIVAVWLLGVVEFVNYFVVRLAYPPHRWLGSVGRLRTPRLVLDMTHRRQGSADGERVRG